MNILLAPVGVLVLTMVDYRRVRVTDVVQRRIFFLMAASALVAIFGDFAYTVAAGRPGQRAFVLAYVACVVYFVAQVTACLAVVLVLDYATNGSVRRLRRLSVLLAAITVAHLTTLGVNVGTGFYFEISPDNLYLRGELYIVRLLFVFVAIPLAIAVMVGSRRNVTVRQLRLLLAFVLLPTVGAIVDQMAGTMFFWPCFGVAVLLAYFFVVRSESRRDGLTGVANRRGCTEFLATLAGAGGRRARAFIMIDVDDFKMINDRFGHDQGDAALKDVAGIVKASVRHSDFVARYGGDEFVIITTTAAAKDHVLARLAGTVDAFNARRLRPYTVALSIGCDVYQPGSADGPQDFLHHVDRLMYEDKRRRRMERGLSAFSP